MSPARRKVFYFSFRSPYSWMAHRLAEQIPDLDIEYRPFFEPDLVTEALLAERGGSVIYTPMSREKHLYMLQDVRRLAGRLGFPLTWPVDREPWCGNPPISATCWPTGTEPAPTSGAQSTGHDGRRVATSVAPT